MSRLLQTSVLVDDVRTELIVQPFADRILVLVTQIGKVGSLIQASIPPTTDVASFDVSNPSPAIQLTPIFGSAPSADMQTLYSLYAAQIATLVWIAIGEPRSVVVGIALQKSKGDQATFHRVTKALQNMLACTQG